MKTIDKLVLKSYLGPMFLTFFIVMFVLVMQFLWRYIDELVGKGLDLSVIIELMFYAAATLISTALPLATLLAAIMTMGNLGENYELLAMKSAGISLPRIIRPLVIVVFVISILSFFANNNLVPYSSKKMSALLYDVRQQRQTIEFKDGIFFNGIDNMSIRVGRQNPQTKLLTDVLIYDNRDVSGNMTTTVADSGYISLSDDKKYLLITLFNGETYENTRNYTKWFNESDLRRNIFDVQNGVIPLSGFDFERTDESLFSGAQTKNIVELEQGIDSLDKLNAVYSEASYGPLLSNYMFQHAQYLVVDSLPKPEHVEKYNFLAPFEEIDMQAKSNVYQRALTNAKNARGYSTFDEVSSKDVLNQLYRYKAEWHRKLSLPVSIMIFFLIGAPLGAIIRKGGLGTPIVVSVAFFVIYYIITITGEKMAREGTWGSFYGMWIATFILAPIAVYLTYKATNDSNLLNSEWYFTQFKKIKALFSKNKTTLKHTKDEKAELTQ